MQAMSGLIVDLGREDSLALLASAPVGQLYSPEARFPLSIRSISSLTATTL